MITTIVGIAAFAAGVAAHKYVWPYAANLIALAFGKH